MIYKFEAFEPEKGRTWKVEFSAVSLYEIIDQFTDFMRGAGFSYIKEIDAEVYNTSLEVIE
jgi:hypothetical protein